MSFSICVAVVRMSSSCQRRLQRLHQRQRIGLALAAGGEARHGVGEDVFTRQTEQVDRLGGDDQGVGGIETAGDADDNTLGAGRAHALHEAGDLDVVGLVAILLEQALVARHERKALDLAQEADVGGRRLQREGILRKKPSRCRRLSSNVPISAPLLPQQIEIDVGERDLAVLPEPLALGQQHAVLVDRGLAVPGEIGGGSACAPAAE